MHWSSTSVARALRCEWTQIHLHNDDNVVERLERMDFQQQQQQPQQLLDWALVAPCCIPGIRLTCRRLIQLIDASESRVPSCPLHLPLWRRTLCAHCLCTLLFSTVGRRGGCRCRSRRRPRRRRVINYTLGSHRRQRQRTIQTIPTMSSIIVRPTPSPSVGRHAAGTKTSGGAANQPAD